MRMLQIVTVLLATSAALSGQSRLQANIPFQFSVSEQVLPAGEYMISPVAKAVDMYTLSAVANNTMVYFRAHPKVVSRERRLPPQVLFRKYGDKYFLAGTALGDVSVEVFRSRMEREFVTVKWIAKTEPETAIIAARIR